MTDASRKSQSAVAASAAPRLGERSNDNMMDQIWKASRPHDLRFNLKWFDSQYPTPLHVPNASQHPDTVVLYKVIATSNYVVKIGQRTHLHQCEHIDVYVINFEEIYIYIL